MRPFAQVMSYNDCFPTRLLPVPSGVVVPTDGTLQANRDQYKPTIYKMQSEYTGSDETEWEEDVAPPTTALGVAATLAAVVLLMIASNCLLSKGRERRNSDRPMPRLWNMIIDSELFGFHTMDKHGNFTTQLLVPVCAIPPLLVLAGLQYNFDVTVTVVVLFPILLLLGGALLMLKTRSDIVNEFKANERQGKTNPILEQELRTFQIQTLFADPDEPTSRVFLIGLSQLMLLGFYVWGLWDAGRPDFSNSRLYGYYYAGVFLQLAYVVGKVRSQSSEKEKAHDSKRRDSVPLDNPVTYQSAFYHCSKFWAYYSGGVQLFHDETRMSCNIRYILDLIVNTAGIFYIMIGLPIQVTHNVDPIDFVLNVVAAFYIVELDDTDGKVVRFTGACEIEMEPDMDDDEESNIPRTEQSLRKASNSSLEEVRDLLVSSLTQEKLAHLSGILSELPMTA